MSHFDRPWTERHIRIMGNLKHECQVPGCPSAEREPLTEAEMQAHRERLRLGRAIDFPIRPPRWPVSPPPLPTVPRFSGGNQHTHWAQWDGQS